MNLYYFWKGDSMRINRIRRLEGINLGDQLEKFGKRLALISGLIGIFALIFNLSEDMKNITGKLDFLLKSYPIFCIMDR